MSDYDLLKICRLRSSKISERIQPIDKIAPIVLNLQKEREYEVSINLIDAIDHYILHKLSMLPTFAQLDKLIEETYNMYMPQIQLKLNIQNESQFKEFCYKRYNNEEQTVKIVGVIIRLGGINILR